jgi:hypothetical protein
MINNPSQKFVPINTIRDGIVELDDGSYIRVLMTSSLNLALKNEDEQTAIISQFQNFFNSLDFHLQIFAKSRRANIDEYIKSLESRLIQINEELLKLQTVEYINYIKSFTAEVNIMEKQFFVIVPYTPAIMGSKSVGGKNSLLSFGSNGSKLQNDALDLQKVKQQMEERVALVTSGLSRCGLKIKELETEEVVELFYSLFNPGIESKTLI